MKREPGRPTLREKIEPERVIEFLKSTTFGQMSGRAIAEKMNINYNSIQAVLINLCRENRLEKFRNGLLVIYKIK